MKKTIIILSILLVTFVNKLNAQTVGVPDTLAHLQTIVANKAFYIGKPFSVLRDSLKIQIKHFSPFASIHYDKSKETSTSYGFYYPQNADEMYLTYPRLRVFWYPYLNANQSDIIYTNANGGGWTADASLFYNNAIVYNIDIL